jgi:D-serine deaminase-like pyridoxal phosphate-dependent protein
LVTVPKDTKLSTQDYVFLIPHQSEAVIPQFQRMSCYTSGQFNQIENLRE